MEFCAFPGVWKSSSNCFSAGRGAELPWGTEGLQGHAVPPHRPRGQWLWAQGAGTEGGPLGEMSWGCWCLEKPSQRVPEPPMPEKPTRVSPCSCARVWGCWGGLGLFPQQRSGRGRGAAAPGTGTWNWAPCLGSRVRAKPGWETFICVRGQGTSWEVLVPSGCASCSSCAVGTGGPTEPLSAQSPFPSEPGLAEQSRGWEFSGGSNQRHPNSSSPSLAHQVPRAVPPPPARPLLPHRVTAA